MSAQPNVVLDLLRAIRNDIGERREKMREVKLRRGSVDVGLASLRREVAQRGGSVAVMSVRMRRFDDRFSRVERRLDLVDEPAT